MIKYKERIENLRTYMEESGIDVYFLPNSSELHYLMGMAKSLYDPTYANSYGDWAAGVYIFLDAIYQLAPRMSVNLGHVAKAEQGLIDDCFVIEEGLPIEDSVKKAFGNKLTDLKKMAFTKNTFSTTLINFKKLIPGIEFASLEDFMNNLRMIKTDYEISKMKEAGQITDKIFGEIVPLLKIGMSDIEIIKEIEYRALREGCQGVSFFTGIMISGGKNKTHWDSAMGNMIEEGCTIAFDYGVVKDGFCSDFGRTVYAGEPTSEMMEIHKIIMDTQKLAIEAMVPGTISCEELNMLARNYIKEKGYDAGFRHRLGHSIGRDVHEYPYLMPGYKELLQKNMAFTIEPSIIIDDKLLIRVEDVVVVGDRRGEPLSKYSKDIIVI